MKIIPFILAVLTASAAAYTVQAYLVRSYYATSVGGQQIMVCVYSANGQMFERYQSVTAGACPYMIQVQ
jgi:hypothetical protein